MHYLEYFEVASSNVLMVFMALILEYKIGRLWIINNNYFKDAEYVSVDRCKSRDLYTYVGIPHAVYA